jgi:hypothetical protein
MNVQFNNTELIKQYVERGKLLNAEEERLRAIIAFGRKNYVKELMKKFNCSNSVIYDAFNGNKPARLAVIHDVLNSESLKKPGSNINTNESEALGESGESTRDNLKS